MSENKKRLIHRHNNENPHPTANFSTAFTAPEQEEDLKRLTLNISIERHRKLKSVAAQKGQSMTTLINQYIDSL